MAIVKERIAQRRETSGSARKLARSVGLPRSAVCCCLFLGVSNFIYYRALSSLGHAWLVGTVF
jgi:hypothetical protein